MPLRTLFFGSFDEPDWDELRKTVAAYKDEQYDGAMAQFSSLSKRGSLISNVYLGRMYQNGEGVDVDKQLALELYYESAKKDLPTAQFYLAQLQRELGNHDHALAWHKIAADHGLVPSMFRLYRMYSLGEGTEPDQAKADQYLLESSKEGHIFAQKHHALRMIRGRYGSLKIPVGILYIMYAFVRGMIKLYKKDEPDLIY